jgi:hypothetical protein
MKINLLLTFDYEIFFGENYMDDAGVLLNPTEELISRSDPSLKFVFFVDIAFIQSLKKYKEEVFEKFVHQLKSLQAKGHELQFHYHPHWYDSHWDAENNKWVFDLTNFSYSLQVKNLGLEKANLLFDEAMSFFNTHFGKTVCYRAGALMLQPYEKELIQQLEKHSFDFDASILPNSSVKSKELSYSFYNCPEAYKWPIFSQSFIKEDGKKTTIYEVPTLSVVKRKISVYDKILLKIRRLLYKEKATFQPSVKRGKSIYNSGFEYDRPLTISFDYTDASQVDYFILLIKKHIKEIGNKEVIISILNHPKCIDEKAIVAMNVFIKKLSKLYELNSTGFNDLNRN